MEPLPRVLPLPLPRLPLLLEGGLAVPDSCGTDELLASSESDLQDTLAIMAITHSTGKVTSKVLLVSHLCFLAGAASSSPKSGTAATLSTKKSILLLEATYAFLQDTEA